MAKADGVGLGSTQRMRPYHSTTTLGWRGVVAVLMGVSALAGVVDCTHGSTEAAPLRANESASASSPAAAPSASPPAPGPIVVSIDALPSNAKIFLDDVVLESNPYEAEHPRDALTHVIRIEAKGFEPQSAHVAFSESVHMHIELVRVLGSAPPARHLPAQGLAPTPSASTRPK